jgi:hypothetical protein
VDTAAPAIPTGIALTAATDTGASASDGVTANNQPTLTGAATAGSLVTVYIDGTAVGTTTADGSGVWQYNVAAPADGAHTVSATATDTAGNVSAAATPGALRWTPPPRQPDRDCADRSHRYRRQRQ